MNSQLVKSTTEEKLQERVLASDELRQQFALASTNEERVAYQKNGEWVKCVAAVVGFDKLSQRQATTQIRPTTHF